MDNSIAVLGAIALDTIATTTTSLRGNAELNIKLDAVTESLGGCAANIVYSLTLHGCRATCIAPLGAADSHRLPPEVRESGLLTGGPMARAFIITDQLGDQRTYFAPGNNPRPDSWHRHLMHQPGHDWVIQAPLDPQLMLVGLQWAKTSSARSIWCPGQYSDQMSREVILQCLPLVDILVSNASEAETLADKVGSLTEVPWRIVTAGADDVRCYHSADVFSQSVPAADVIDPTGCGDAFIAGMVATLSAAEPGSTDLHNMRQAIINGIALAQTCLQVSGCQNHTL